MNFKERIMSYSKDIGIDLIGFTNAKPFEDLREILIRRRERGYLSGFEEENIELRTNPKKTLDSAKSIIVIGISYYIKKENLGNHKEPKFYGELARTAWGKDYHIVLKDKLEKLASFILSEYKGLEYKAFVDTGPLVDRYLADRAGIGFYGYNSTIINKDFGSWIFLGYMITNIPLEKDKPLDATCIGCNLCIENCPNSAIEKPYDFNANKCLSNILQQKKDVPENALSKLDNKIYGCDICQNVCPHNKDIKEATSKEFIPRELPHKVDLISLLNLSNKEYKTLFKENASGWRGKKILQRNAIIALGNSKNKDAIEFLKPLLKDVRPDIRKITIWALYNIDSKYTLKLLPDIKLKEKEEDVLKVIDKYLKISNNNI